MLVAATLVAAAYAAAPHACKGGLEAYLGAGVVALLALVVLPFATRIGQSALTRVVWAAGFGAFGVCAWIAGLVLANVRFICGLGYL
jgi:hypothetical protein